MTNTFEILDTAAQFCSTAHEAANIEWNDNQQLVDYLLIDHIPKKYHKLFISQTLKFVKDVQRI